MSDADDIERIVGVARHSVRHYGRAVSSEQTVYVLHSATCRDSGTGLHCPYSVALDRGIQEYDWSDREDMPVLLRIERGRLIPDRGEGVVRTRLDRAEGCLP